MEEWAYSQHVGNDADTPDVSREVDGVILDDFRCHEFWGAKEHTQLLPRVIFTRQAKVDYFNSVARLRQTQDIFRLATEQATLL